MSAALAIANPSPRRPIWPFDIIMPHALLVMHSSKHIAGWRKCPAIRARTTTLNGRTGSLEHVEIQPLKP
jgi:hypothetical protein